MGTIIYDRMLLSSIIYNIVYNVYMGLLEKELEKDIRTSKIQNAILQTVAAAGFLSLAILAPNTLKFLNKYIKNKPDLKNKNRSINRSRNTLIKKGLITYSKNNSLELTQKGLKVLERIRLKNFKITKPKKWDHKWRILIFDIKESHKNIRNEIRQTLNFIGFIKLQNSVWVYPYDCEDYITLLKTDFNMNKEVLYIIADKIENEKSLLKRFDLGNY